VTAVVVNYNTGGLLLKCVEALLEADAVQRVMVVDNASSDRGVDALRTAVGHDPRIRIIQHSANLGFAPAVNACVPEIASEYALIINPDCVLAPGALQQLLDALAGNEHAALAGPRVMDGKGRIEPASLRNFPRPWNSLLTVTGLSRLGRWWPGLAGVASDTAGQVRETTAAQAVSGACMLLRTKALVAVGCLDAAYGLHCEDLDLMYRLHLAGWGCLYVPGAVAVHEQGVSSRSRPYWVHRQKHLGMVRFYRKFLADHYAGPVTWLVLAGIWLHYLLLLPFLWLKK
jgi:GT2 family glycosyltransferase